MGLASESIPNRPLRGDELAEYAIKLMRDRLKNAHHFSAQVTYHQVAFELTGVFHFAYPVGDTRLLVQPLADGTVTGVPPTPLVVDAEGEQQPSEVVAFELASAIEDPNLTRVHCELPVTVTVKTPPKPGEVFPHIEQHQVKYDPTDYPPLAPPAERSLVAEKEKQFNITRKSGKRR